MKAPRCARVVVIGVAGLAAGCGEFARSSRSPSQLVIVSLLTARGTGAGPATFVDGPLASAVPNTARGEPSAADFGQVTIATLLRDPGTAGGAAPTPLNDVTITQYRVAYRGRPGVDVPYPFDGALAFTIPVGATGTGVFELVRRVAKLEPPLSALAANAVILATVADVTFFGRDQAGNRLSVTASVQIDFGRFEAAR